MNLTKILPAIICLQFFATTTQAQEVQVVERNWFAFNQFINVTPFRGMNFRLESMAKVEITPDSLARMYMWVRVDVEKGRGFFDNMDDRPVTSNKWTNCIIEGRIDTNAISLYFGGVCYFSGSFYFDHFKLKIETKRGWKDIPIKNAGFEQPSYEPWGFGISRKVVYKIKGFEPFLVRETAKNKVLKISATNIPAYGIDRTKGNYFSTNGVNLYYEIYGKGEPLLLLHGNGQSISAFGKQISFFEKEYQVIIPDCRGRGKSTIDDTELTYDIQASDINNLLDHLHIDSANIIGWSDGGIIGLIMAKDYPKKVKRVVTSGANVLQDSTAFLPGDIPKFNKIIADTTRSLMTRRRYKLMRDHPNIPVSELGKITCPALIVAGDKDEILIGHTIKIYESIPRGQLFIVPGSSHYLLFENHKVFNEAALKFLKEN